MSAGGRRPLTRLPGMIPVYQKLDGIMVNRLNREARRRGIPRQELVRRLLIDALSRCEP